MERARQELASDDPASLRNYLERKRRDKRLDPAVKKALREGTKVPADVARKAVNGYASGLEKLRAETIGQFEAGEALSVGRDEAFRQAVADGKFTEDEIEREWDSANDIRVRFTHSVLNKQKRSGLSEPFVSPSGARMRFPKDRKLGAPASELVGCRCVCAYRVRWLDRIR